MDASSTTPAEPQSHTPAPSRLLSLPAELRLRIYSFALAPTGTLYLHRTPSKRHAVTPAISPALLATNRQINAEAAGILYVENTVHIALDAHDTAWPAINEARLPQRVLQKLEHLCLLLDCTAVLWRGYDGVDFEALTALTALRSLRLRVLALPDAKEFQDEDEDDGQDGQANNAGGDESEEPTEPSWKFPAFARLAVEILERVPASTKIYYGVDAEQSEHTTLEDAPETVEGPQEPFDKFYTPKYQLSTMPGQTHINVAKEVSKEDLLASLERVDLGDRRGCRAGTVQDVWGDYRELFLGRAYARV
ncbi:hypothetical protein Q7P37_005758 [Cladosporium fusiforme]